MKLEFRTTAKSEYYETENTTREAFWNLYKPGCDEHLVLHQLRLSGSYIGDLDHVAIYDGKIISHVISTKALVIDPTNKQHHVLCVGPLSVLPQFQSKGVGTQLLNYSIAEARKLGFSGMILFGNPNYYHRFGFVNAQKYSITTKDGQNFEPFMALELRTKGFDSIKGKFFEDEAFTTNENELEIFEKKFPKKLKGNPKIILNL